MPVHWPSLFRRAGAVALAAALLAACQESQVPKQFKPVPTELSEKMKKMDMSETGPVFIRIFKESSELEVWKQKRNGKYALLKTYNVCKWSGELGPKIAEGDRQAPEGFYTVTPAQMNPKSSYYLSFNIGYPNSFDRAHDRTGSHLMVHGACSSAGCYSMTDEDAGELFALARDSFRGGQRAFQIQAFPFRMTPQNMAKHRDNKNFAFWQLLKTGSDHFELTRVPPKVDVCDKRYVFNADAGGRSFSPKAACPAYAVPEGLKIAVARKQAADEAAMGEAATQLAQQANKAAEEKRIAEEKRLAAESKAAERQAAKEAKAEQNSERRGIFGRMFGGDKKASEPPAVAAAPAPPAADAAETPVTAFAPAATPVPPKKPAANAAASPPGPPPAPPPPASPASMAASSPPPAPPPAAAPVAEAEPTITPEMTPAIPQVGRFVKKEFLWIGEDGGSQGGG
jgi:murein L,D-transpeptidase YafK